MDTSEFVASWSDVQTAWGTWSRIEGRLGSCEVWLSSGARSHFTAHVKGDSNLEEGIVWKVQCSSGPSCRDLGAVVFNPRYGKGFSSP